MNLINQKKVRNPLITVLMSVYNGEQWLEESIMSVLVQTFTDFEFIIVNDGSTDRSLDIINKFTQLDDRITVVNKTNTGLADSLNYGLRVSNGKWVARLDADDVCMPERLHVLHEYVNSSHDLVLVGSAFIEIDKTGSLGRKQKYPSNHVKLIRNLERHKRFFPHSSAFFKADAAREIFGYNTRIVRSQDHDFWLRLSDKGKVACLNKPLVKIRFHNDQISNEESGVRQLYFDYASTICHFLRKNKMLDPSADFNEDEWFAFLDWVRTEVNKKANFICKSKIRNDSRFILRSGELKLFLRIRLFHKVVLSDCFYQILTEKFLGTSLPENLAGKWQSMNLIGGRSV
jgi:glycosyltransferase involved in cell wall biosynthesis